MKQRFFGAALLCALAALHLNVRARCQDPTLQRGRFQQRWVELLHLKSGLVWFRCPVLWVDASGHCDPSMVLPSETWAAAMVISPTALGRTRNWRLASVEELDTLAAKGCGYLVNPKQIELMFDGTRIP